jgi:nucleotide-binding universal stress UspA family protein
MLPIRLILQPTDFTVHAQYAFQLACALARDYGAKLVIFHAFPTPILPVTEGATIPISMEIPREELWKQLNKMQPPDAKIVLERVLTEGDPVYEILRAASAYHADLIVMGTHGRGGVSRFVMGSVAEAVSRKANCPVVTVRTKPGVASR